MKLISCHIISFGKLYDKKFEFDNHLTVIKEGNSFGKTTLANFITSMFYGLPDLKVKDLSNDRRRYDPWQGGVYGGSLIFEYENKKFQIERDFNRNEFRLSDVTTVAKKNVFQINGKPIEASNLGDVLFDINKNSFKRSAYIPQDEIISGEIESGLNDKLRNLINATEENHSLDKSLNILQKAVETIETKRGKGKLKEIEERIVELNNKIEECKICSDNAEQARKELKVLEDNLIKYKKELEKIDNQIKYQNEVDTLSAQQKHLFTIKENIKNCEEKIEKLIPFFNNQNIENIDIGKIKDIIDAYKKQQKVFKDIEDDTLAERSKLLSLEEASLARQERKRTLKTQVEVLENDKRRILDEKDKVEEEIFNLKNSKRKHKGLLFTILCIFTFGLYYVFIKKIIKWIAK